MSFLSSPLILLEARFTLKFIVARGVEFQPIKSVQFFPSLFAASTKSWNSFYALSLRYAGLRVQTGHPAIVAYVTALDVVDVEVNAHLSGCWFFGA